MIKRWKQADVVFLAVLLRSACHVTAEQDKVKKVVHKVQQAAENKNIKQALSCLSNTYRDPRGNTYNDIKDLLLYSFFRHAKISIFITGLEVRVDGPAARAVFQAVLSGRSKTGSAGDIVPDALGAYDFEVALALESGEWRIVSAKWERLGDAPLDKSR